MNSALKRWVHLSKKFSFFISSSFCFDHHLQNVSIGNELLFGLFFVGNRVKNPINLDDMKNESFNLNCCRFVALCALFLWPFACGLECFWDPFKWFTMICSEFCGDREWHQSKLPANSKAECCAELVLATCGCKTNKTNSFRLNWLYQVWPLNLLYGPMDDDCDLMCVVWTLSTPLLSISLHGMFKFKFSRLMGSNKKFLRLTLLLNDLLAIHHQLPHFISMTGNSDSHQQKADAVERKRRKRIHLFRFVCANNYLMKHFCFAKGNDNGMCDEMSWASYHLTKQACKNAEKNNAKNIKNFLNPSFLFYRNDMKKKIFIFGRVLSALKVLRWICFCASCVRLLGGLAQTLHFESLNERVNEWTTEWLSERMFWHSESILIYILQSSQTNKLTHTHLNEMNAYFNTRNFALRFTILFDRISQWAHFDLFE